MEENKSIKTNVSFESAGLKLAVHLYTPDPDTSPSLPAIVVGTPGSSVKEQAARMYARRLADRGFITLAFDPAYQGESEGEPRGLEDPPTGSRILRQPSPSLVRATRLHRIALAHWASAPLVAT